MLKILVASSKGGCGKSTLATNLAAHFAHSGKNTALLDGDRQGSSFRWAQKRPEGVPGVLGVEGVKRGWVNKLPEDTARVVVDSAAGSHREELDPLIEEVDAVLVPVLPSAIDLEASQPFLKELAGNPRIRRGTVPVGIVANRLKPWTNAAHAALEKMKELRFPVIAQLRDSTGYVVLTGLGKSIWDYGSEQITSHQDDWAPLIRWIKKLGS
jgi:chromosome partitioning protein